MQEVYGGEAHLIMRPGEGLRAFEKRAVLVGLLRSAASYRTSVKVGGRYMDGGGLSEMVGEVRDAHTAWADRAPGPFSTRTRPRARAARAGWAAALRRQRPPVLPAARA